jgi:hypothetical protein
MAQQALPYTLPDIPNNEAWKRTGEMFTDLFSLQSQIISAGDARFANPTLYPTVESKISAARVQAAVELKTIVSIPAVHVLQADCQLFRLRYHAYRLLEERRRDSGHRHG